MHRFIATFISLLVALASAPALRPPSLPPTPRPPAPSSWPPRPCPRAWPWPATTWRCAASRPRTCASSRPRPTRRSPASSSTPPSGSPCGRSWPAGKAGSTWPCPTAELRLQVQPRRRQVPGAGLRRADQDQGVRGREDDVPVERCAVDSELALLPTGDHNLTAVPAEPVLRGRRAVRPAPRRGDDPGDAPRRARRRDRHAPGRRRRLGRGAGRPQGPGLCRYPRHHQGAVRGRGPVAPQCRRPAHAGRLQDRRRHPARGPAPQLSRCPTPPSTWAGTPNRPWGRWSRSGFRFNRGAIAYHLQSFSGAAIRDPKTHWVGPLLAHGACVTAGAVYEPFLGRHAACRYLYGPPAQGLFLGRGRLHGRGLALLADVLHRRPAVQAVPEEVTE